MASGSIPVPFEGAYGVKGATQSWGTSLTFNARGNIIVMINGETVYSLWSSGGGLRTYLLHGSSDGISITRDSNYNITVTTSANASITAFWLKYT